ncbi:hypothetical protein [uncultured Psychroserpens sp.]|uniref:hypothetical protein n=1 Tax=uncultured Psychroserpens sp. TaxID=255436 RepID=UPI002601A6CC|nr:hypothetical protein [uncultured Psychroserpens sp.]
MKKIYTLIVLLFVAFGYSQEQKITIDYTVDYIIPNNRKGTADTITIGYSKNGKHLWTNSEYLAKDLGKSMFKSNSKMMENADLDIIYDSENSILIMHFESGKNDMFINMDLETLMTKQISFNEDDEFELISENTKESIDVAGHKTTIYDLYPSNKPSDIISVAFDESIEIQNNTLFKSLFELIFAAEGSANLLGMNLPNGLIMKATNKGNTMIEAYKIDTRKKTININYSFKITE